MNAAPEKEQLSLPLSYIQEESLTLQHHQHQQSYHWYSSLWQLFRFGVVGGLNTTIDLLVLNSLLWLFPTSNAPVILGYNSFAYAIGAINSFVLNKYWTFEHRQRTTVRQLVRFVLTTCAGITCNDAFLWLFGRFLQPVIGNTTLWTNVAKIIAIFVTASVSYIGMRLWVFVSHSAEKKSMQYEPSTTTGVSLSQPHQPQTEPHIERVLPPRNRQHIRYTTGTTAPVHHTLSVVLPAHNEEQIIAATVVQVRENVQELVKDFEIIVVNDGSTDATGQLVAQLAARDARIRLVTHPVNQGYGAALVSGFQAATKELTFFMDSDGQFDIRDLGAFLSLIDDYDAVIGYRTQRQDTWMRKLNAWGWKELIGLVLGVHVQDIDCAFKLLHTQFLRDHPLETRGAMINAELLYKLTQEGCSYREVGVQHLPRQSGQATGAKLSVILRAFRELFTYSRKWHQEERLHIHARETVLSR